MHRSTTISRLALTAVTVVLLGLELSPSSRAQSNTFPIGTSVGISLQAYPAGFIPAVHAQAPVTRRMMAVLFVGYNVTDRRDWGEHDNEEGSGFGAGLSLRHYFDRSRSGIFAGIRSDIWFLSIDWRDLSFFEQGVTDVTVLQPTVQVGYDYAIGKRMVLGATLAFGGEFNIKTDGEEVGQGAILLGGLRVTYRLPSTP